jgi:hypothetical protein
MKTLTVFRAHKKAAARFMILSDRIRKYENGTQTASVHAGQYIQWYDEKIRRHRQLFRFEQWLETSLGQVAATALCWPGPRLDQLIADQIMDGVLLPYSTNEAAAMSLVFQLLEDGNEVDILMEKNVMLEVQVIITWYDMAGNDIKAMAKGHDLPYVICLAALKVEPI